MLKKKIIQISGDGTLYFKNFSVILRKKKHFVFFDQKSTTLLKNYKLESRDSIKNSIYRKKYF
jgi:hypothetical protein